MTKVAYLVADGEVDIGAIEASDQNRWLFHVELSRYIFSHLHIGCFQCEDERRVHYGAEEGNVGSEICRARPPSISLPSVATAQK